MIRLFNWIYVIYARKFELLFIEFCGIMIQDQV